LSQEVCGVRRCFSYLTTSLWSYNQSLEVWEPIMEPWQLLLHMDTNPNPQSSAGIQPGTWIRLTSPHGCVHVTLAQAALNSCLDALTDWQAGSAAAADAWGHDSSRAEQGPGKTGLAAADGLHVYTTFTNTLDTAAYLQLNYGEGRKQVVALPPHVATPLTQPLPVPPTSHAPLTASQTPPVRLVVDILDGKLLSELAGTGSIPELSVKVSCAVLWGLVPQARVLVEC
jgi:vacuolar protein sorting-associated protein 13A/C